MEKKTTPFNAVFRIKRILMVSLLVIGLLPYVNAQNTCSEAADTKGSEQFSAVTQPTSHWFKFTAYESGAYVSKVNTSNSVGIDIYAGDCSNLDSTMINSAWVSEGKESAPIQMVQGKTYYIQITQGAEVGSFYWEFTLEAIQQIPLTDFSIAQRELTLKLDNDSSIYYIYDLGLNFVPSNATDKSFSVLVMDSTILKFENNHLYPRGEGSTDVRLVTSDGHFSATCAVTVIKDEKPIVPALCDSARLVRPGINDFPGSKNTEQWFAFIPEEKGNYKITLNVDKYPLAHIAVYTGSCDNLYLEKEETNFVPHESNFQFKAIQDMLYFIMIDAKEYNEDEPVDFTWTLEKQPIVTADVSGWVRLQDKLNATSGVVHLYSVENRGEYFLVDSVEIQQTGLYEFKQVETGDYLIKAIARDNDNLLPTYYTSAETWESATVLSIRTSETLLYKDIQVIELESLSGSAVIRGYVEQEVPNLARVLSRATNDNAYEGLDVFLQQKTANGPKTVAKTKTNEEGMFEFTGVAIGNYSILIDIPGLPMVSTQDIAIEREDQVIVDNVYQVTENGIVETNTVGVEKETDKFDMSIYPNPVVDELRIETNGTFINAIFVCDITGKIVKAFSYKSEIESLSLDLSDLTTGIYLLKINTNNGGFIEKLIKK